MISKMKKRNLLTLGDEFLEYCKLNNIEDIEKLGKDTFQRGFTILKYGETPTGGVTKDTIVEKEVVKEVIREVIVEVDKIINVEVIKEVPVEVIKEIIVEKIVEVIKEVPIQVKGDTQVITKEIIKEVPIEKIVYKDVINKESEIAKDKVIDELKLKNTELQTQLDKITASLSNLNKGSYLKGSDLSNLYGE